MSARVDAKTQTVPYSQKIIKSYYSLTLNNTINNKKPLKVAEINNNYYEFGEDLFRP